MSPPLEGVRVVEFGQLIGAPNAGMVLADLGADVVKVEPFAGDAGRELQSRAFAGTSASPTYLAFNRGKRSVALDLKHDDGRAVASQLAATADVVVESFRPGAMERLGLGFDQVVARNPAVVYGSLSGFGRQGPERDRRGVDMVIQAESGIMAVTGEADGPPMKVGFTVVDVAAGNVLAQGLLAALLRRERTGEGGLVEVSLLEVALHLQAAPLSEFLATGDVPARCGNAAPMTAPADLLRTGDGYLVVSAYLDDHWCTFCDAIGRPALAGDARFATKVARVANRPALIEELESALAAKGTGHWLTLLQSAGLVVGEVRDYAQVAESAQVAALGAVVDADGPAGSAYRTVRLPVSYGGWGRPSLRPPPEVGEHTAEVLREQGYGDHDIERLAASGGARIHRPTGRERSEV